MNKWVIGTFYTKDTPYEEVYHNYLETSCKKLGLENKLIPVEIQSLGNWNKNTAQKPKIILDLLSVIKQDECLVFLDADATIEKYPEIFDNIPNKYDIAYHVLKWETWYGYPAPNRELLTGTMFFRNTFAVRELCKEWYQKAQESLMWEQKVLQNIITSSSVLTYPLEIEYCFMKTRPGNLEPLIKTEPIILHHQMSRTLKKGKL